MKKLNKKILSLLIVFTILIQAIIPSMAIEKDDNDFNNDNISKTTEIVGNKNNEVEEREEKESEEKENGINNDKTNNAEVDNTVTETKPSITPFASGISVTAYKKWVGGPTPRPTVKFELWRTSSITSDENVSESDNGGIKELPNGVTSVSWHNLAISPLGWGLINYKYYVKEISSPADYDVNYSSDKLTVTNTYKSPKIDISVENKWDETNGKEDPRPTVKVQLYRNGEKLGKPEDLKNDEHTWEKQDKYDNNGKEYEYFVEEVRERLDFYVPMYENTNLKTTITNVYYNLDKLDKPVEAPPLNIITDSMPKTEFGNVSKAKGVELLALNPGEVQVDKKATPVPGMVNTWDIELKIEGKSEQKTSDIVLVIDRSGSMAGNRIAEAKAAAKEFVNTLLTGTGANYNRIAIVSYATNVTINHNLSNNANSLKNAIDSISATGGTHTQGGIHQADLILNSSTADYKNIVLLSDGEPTYSYGITNQAWRTYYTQVSEGVRHTGTTVPEDRFSTSNVGSGNSLTTYIEGYQSHYYYYNHGNSAIAQAGFAKNNRGANNRIIYTVAFAAGTTGTPILNQIASPGKAYTGLAGDLESIFNTIAGSILAPMKGATITDPMGAGFILSSATPTITASQGDATYNSTTKTINWDMGDLSKPANATIKEATLKYRVEITDDILNATPVEGSDSTNKLYFTNGNTKVDYKNAANVITSKDFPKPKVNPLFLKVGKILGAGGSVEKEFEIKIVGPAGKNYTEIVNLKGGEDKVLTSLRHAGAYTVSEVGETDYDTTIEINGVAGDTFTVAPPTNTVGVLTDSKQADIDVKVTNNIKKPKLDKWIVEGSTDTKIVNKAIGDTINYKLTTKVPDMLGYSTFKVVDTMENGLTFNTGTVVVKVNGVIIPPTSGTTTIYTINHTGQVLTIDFKKFNSADKGKDLVITYSATLNTNAEIGTANENSAKIVYQVKGGTETETDSVNTKTFTTSLEINKVIKGTTTPLTGAKFKIVRTDGNLNKVIVTGLGDPTTITYPNEVTGEVDEDGKLIFAGLQAGSYTVTEIQSPNGFALIDPFDITISFDKNTEKFTLKKDNTVIGESGNTLSMTVDNESGIVFPETGGSGTRLIYGLGMVLVLGSGIVLATKSKRKKTDEG